MLHILMNSWVLFDLGAQVEAIYGASRMWVIYFPRLRWAGSLLSAWWNPGISIGASAGLCGLMGAMIALGMRHRNPDGERHPRACTSAGRFILLIWGLLMPRGG